MPQLPRVRVRMTPRDTAEAARVSSPLELLFDLTFVVAVAQVASRLAHAIAHGETLSNGIGPYLMVFFAIWWAWINFTWFASAYDTDDVPYRLLTMLQMGGVLVLAAGVPAAFSSGNFVAIVVGYVIMRVALVGQWLRAGIENPESRAMAFRYASAIIIVQVGWVARLFLPADIGVWSFVILALLEVLVPVYAEHNGLSAWHAHHIAERYGLFTIILLGESVSAITIAVQGIVSASGVTVNLLLVAIAGLVLLFSLWWLYFMESPGEGLKALRSRSFAWGYGHYFLFAAVAAIGAALEVAVEARHGLSPVVAGYALGIPVAVYFIALASVTALLRVQAVTRPVTSVVAAILVLVVPLFAPAIGIPLTAVAIAVIAAALTTLSIVTASRRGARTDRLSARG
jgi:low temperature requirement protein LtrA